MINKARNNIVTLTRADSGYFLIPVVIGTTSEPEHYKLQDGDKVYFGLCEYNKKFEHAILKKVFTKDNVIIDEHDNEFVKIKLESDDTVNLVPGTYFYEIKLEKVIEFGLLENKTDVHTIVPRTKFIIID